jgi:serine/threonine-protein phosphatase 2A regulatory subunit B''
MENKSSKQSIEYMWRLLDIKHNNQVDVDVIRFFFSSILRQMGNTELKMEDVADEIFDMVRKGRAGMSRMRYLIW